MESRIKTGAGVPRETPETEHSKTTSTLKTTFKHSMESSGGLVSSMPDSSHRLKNAMSEGAPNLKGSLLKGEGRKSEHFERSPRIKLGCPTGEIQIEERPAASKKPEINWLSTLMPAGATVLMAVVMVVLGVGMFALYSLPVTIAGVVVSIVNYRNSVKKFQAEQEENNKRYEQYLAEKTEEVRKSREKQRAALVYSNPDPTECVKIVKKREPRLWARTPDDEDFVAVRLGRGPVKPSVSVKLAQVNSASGFAATESDAQKILRDFSVLEKVPVCISLRENRLWGIAGSMDTAARLAGMMILHLSTHHSPSELKIAVICDAKNESDFLWARDLPHCRAGGRTYIASNRKSAERLFDELAELFRKRGLSSDGSHYDRPQDPIPYYVLFILQLSYLDRTAPICKYLFDSNGLGLSAVMSADRISHFPKECKTFAELSGTNGELYSAENSQNRQLFTVDNLVPSELAACSRSMSDLHDGKTPEPAAKPGGGLSAELPSEYSLYDLLSVKAASQIDLKARWQRRNILEEIVADIGIGPASAPVSLDIHEKFGPHSVVIGTVGSGKSEFLYSMILSFALNYHPYELAFLFIDFKSNVAFRYLYDNLPHAIGLLTDLDGESLNRSFRCISAELRRRKAHLASYGCTDIYAYQKLYKRDPSLPPFPHVLVIVDEFAELKKSHADFLKELISISQIGRNLGVHLTLATQTPSVVNDEILNNTTHRVCLKVLDPKDSKAILGSEAASGIEAKGRGFLKTMPTDGAEFFGEFQSGYSGAPSSHGDSGSTQFKSIVNRLRDYCAEQNIRKLPDVILPELPSILDYPACESPVGSKSAVSLGIYENPDNQLQTSYKVELGASNLLIIGSTRTGKTNLLKVIIRALAEKYSPGEVSMYILDFASTELKRFEKLNHVGGVVTASEEERLRNLMNLLLAEIDARKKLGIGSFSAFREAGGHDLPYIVVLIDNFSSLKELYLEDDTDFLRICREGLSVGISVILANAQTHGISIKYPAHFGTRIALYNQDSDAYYFLFQSSRESLPEIPGRCLVEIEKARLHCQLYRAFPGDSELESRQAAERFVDAVQQKYGDLHAGAIPEVPDFLTEEYIVEHFTEEMRTPYNLVTGIEYSSVSPLVLNLSRIGCLSVAGGTGSSQGAVLDYMIRMLGRAYPGKTRVWIADGIEQNLRRAALYENVEDYSIFDFSAIEYVNKVEALAKARYAEVMEGGLGLLDDAELLVLVVNSSDAADCISQDRNASSALGNLLGKYKSMNVCVLSAGVPNASFYSTEFYKKVLENKLFFWLDNLNLLKIVPPPYQKNKTKLSDGDVFFYDGADFAKLRIPMISEE